MSPTEFYGTDELPVDTEAPAVCDRCGALVGNDLRHDGWHDEINESITYAIEVARGEQS